MAEKNELERKVPFITGPGKIRVDIRGYTRNGRVANLAALKIYHQRKILEIDRELEMLLEDQVNSIDY